MARSTPLKTVRGQLRRAVEEARRSGRMSAALEVDALLADLLAAEVDRAKGADRVRAIVQLRAAMDRLPLEEPAGPVGGGSGDGGDDERVRVLRALDSPPQVGDSAHA